MNQSMVRQLIISEQGIIQSAPTVHRIYSPSGCQCPVTWNFCLPSSPPGAAHPKHRIKQPHHGGIFPFLFLYFSS